MKNQDFIKNKICFPDLGAPVPINFSLILFNLFKDKNLTAIEDWAPVQSNTASFLVDIGEYDIAEKMLKEVISELTKTKGEDAKELGEPTFIMVNLLFKKGWIISNISSLLTCAYALL